MRSSRPLLAVVCLVFIALAGCSAPGSLAMDPVDDGELGDHASRSLPATEAESDPDRELRLIRGAIRNGSATIDSRSAPVEAGLPFAFRGAYYNLSWSVADRQPATHATIEIDYNATNSSVETITYAELPSVDRRALDTLLPPRDDRRTEGYDFGTGVTYSESEREQSVLLSGHQYDAVVYRGTAYRVRVSDTREITVNTYRYTSTLVAANSTAYADQLRQQYRFTLDGLSAEERRIVTEALSDGSYYAESEDDAFRSVLERFQRHEAVQENDYHGEWLLRYNGTDYWAELRYGGFDGE